MNGDGDGQYKGPLLCLITHRGLQSTLFGEHKPVVLPSPSLQMIAFLA